MWRVCRYWQQLLICCRYASTLRTKEMHLDHLMNCTIFQSSQCCGKIANLLLVCTACSPISSPPNEATDVAENRPLWDCLHSVLCTASGAFQKWLNKWMQHIVINYRYRRWSTDLMPLCSASLCTYYNDYQWILIELSELEVAWFITGLRDTWFWAEIPDMSTFPLLAELSHFLGVFLPSRTRFMKFCFFRIIKNSTLTLSSSKCIRTWSATTPPRTLLGVYDSPQTR